jgi:hypothetical protein
MKKLSSISAVLFMLFFVFSCDDPAEEMQPTIDDELSCRPFFTKPSKVTGFVKVEWKGKGGKENDEQKHVFASFVAHESTIKSARRKFVPPRGFFLFSVYKEDYTLERKIVAKVLDVGFGDPADKKAWLFAEVISDTKCESSDHSGCSDSDHTDGGCSHDDDGSHDGGCSHDDGGTVHDDSDSGGGCSHDDSDSEGGCSHDDGTDEGCDHDDTDSDHDSGSGGKPDDKGGKGKKCRVGQYLVAKMHDKGSPGVNDGITWKWFENLDGFSIESEPKHLCKKEILKGNLTVHIAKSKNDETGL